METGDTQMTMQHAIDEYLAAKTEADLAAAYNAMVENFAEDPDLPDDADFESGVDALLDARGLPALMQRLHQIKMAEIEAGNATRVSYQIENDRTGVVLGVYSAATEADALEAMARNAGYLCYAEACEIDPTLDDDLIVTEVNQ
jgi:hypothetical protein